MPADILAPSAAIYASKLLGWFSYLCYIYADFMLIFVFMLYVYMVTFNTRSLFSCNQAALRLVQSVCLSIPPSVCPSVHRSHLFHYVPIIISSCNFQELLPLTQVMSMQKVKVKRSMSQRSKPNLAISGPLLHEFTYGNEMMYRAWCGIRKGALLSFKVIHQISRSHETKNCWFSPKLRVSRL